MEQIAYRFVLCDDKGRPRENSQYTMLTTEQLDSDRFGNDVPLAGTLVCRGVA